MRTATHQLTASALAAFRRVIAPLGWHLDGDQLTVQHVTRRLHTRAAADLDGARAAALGRAGDDRAVWLVVADRVLEPARPVLARNGWSWYDRRGHLRIQAEGLYVDTPVPAEARPAVARRSTTFAGEAAREIAYEMLCTPGTRIAAADLQASCGVSRSATYAALKSLRGDGLLHGDGHPVVPDLFWALAAVWTPAVIELAHVPTESPVFGAGDLDAPGACLAGTTAALLHNVPIVASLDAPPSILVPDESGLYELRAANDGPAGVVAIAPVRSALRRRRRAPHTPWPVAAPLTVALELAADRARGIEILDRWHPPERVW